MEASNHPHQLTEEEKKYVRQLKQKCDEEGVKYKSIFELAKFVLVSTSLPESKRLNDSFKRIKGHRADEERLDDIKPEDAISIAEAMPEGHRTKYGTNDKGQHIIQYSYKDMSQVNKLVSEPGNFEKFLLYCLRHNDLAAADMVQARMGHMYVVDASNVSFGTLAATLKHIYQFSQVQDPKHPFRIKKIYIKCPSMLLKIARITMKIFPAKMQQRMVFCKSNTLEEDKITFDPTLTQRQWWEAQNAKFRESEQKITLD